MKRGTDDYTVVLGRNNINTQLTSVIPQLQDLVYKYSCVCTRWPRAAGQYLYIYYYWAPLRCSAPRCLVTKEKHSAACRPADLIWRLQSVMIVSADTVITLQESGVSHMSDTLPYWLLFTVYEILNLFLVYCIYIGHSHGVPDISYTAHTW